MTLFEECVEALGEDTQILNLQETESYFDELVKKFPVTAWQRLDWDNILIKEKINDLNAIFQWLKKININNTEVILLWNYTGEPAVKTDLKKALEVIDDVTAVGSDTFIFCPKSGYVIEFYHEGEVTIGLSNEQK